MISFNMGENLLFRKAIVPWYDSETACYAVFTLMFVILLFGVLGLSAAREVTAYRGYTWVPVALILMSLAVLVSTIIRLVRRVLRRYPG